jgi:hypothetical protein
MCALQYDLLFSTSSRCFYVSQVRGSKVRAAFSSVPTDDSTVKQEGRVMVQAVSCQLLRTCSKPRLVHVGFLGDRVAQGSISFSKHFGFHQWSITIY